MLSMTISYILAFMVCGSNNFLHYFIPLAPLFFLTALISMSSKSRTAIALSLLFMPLAVVVHHDQIGCIASRLLGRRPDITMHEQFHEFIRQMPAAERKSIYNAGLNHMGAGLLADEQVCQCNRIIYRSHKSDSKRLAAYEAEHTLADMNPVWVLVQEAPDRMTLSTIEAKYHPADTIPGGEFPDIVCYRRNQ